MHAVSDLASCATTSSVAWHTSKPLFTPPAETEGVRYEPRKSLKISHSLDIKFRRAKGGASVCERSDSGNTWLVDQRLESVRLWRVNFLGHLFSHHRSNRENIRAPQRSEPIIDEQSDTPRTKHYSDDVRLCVLAFARVAPYKTDIDSEMARYSKRTLQTHHTFGLHFVPIFPAIPEL
jgi:hypothetical protein